VAVENIEKVVKLICSQEVQPGTSRSTRKIAAELYIHCSFAQRIAKHDLRLTAFRRAPAQVISDTINQNRLGTLPKTSSISANDSYKEGVFH